MSRADQAFIDLYFSLTNLDDEDQCDVFKAIYRDILNGEYDRYRFCIGLRAKMGTMGEGDIELIKGEMERRMS
ncbi:MAG: hypothetical protein AAFR76_01430 [Planctomycetota bacterium]